MVEQLITNETPVEKLQRDFRKELTDQMKDAAHKLGCPVEQMKCRVGNDGVVEIAHMTEQETEDMHREESLKTQIRAIKKARERFYV